MSIAGLTECNLSNHDFKYAQSAVSSLAPFYGAGILTFVTAPETESERDFLRSRQFVLHQLSETGCKNVR